MEHEHDFRPVWFRYAPSQTGTIMVLGPAPSFLDGPTFYLCTCGEQGFA